MLSVEFECTPVAPMDLHHGDPTAHMARDTTFWKYFSDLFEVNSLVRHHLVSKSTQSTMRGFRMFIVQGKKKKKKKKKKEKKRKEKYSMRWVKEGVGWWGWGLGGGDRG